jgi:hypothetical protein
MDAIRQALLNGEINAESDINVRIYSGPLADRCFRSGMFPVAIGGIEFSYYSSIYVGEGAQSLEENKAVMEQRIREYIGRAMVQYEENGELFYRYTLQSIRL